MIFFLPLQNNKIMKAWISGAQYQRDSSCRPSSASRLMLSSRKKCPLMSALICRQCGGSSSCHIMKKFPFCCSGTSLIHACIKAFEPRRVRKHLGWRTGRDAGGFSPQACPETAAELQGDGKELNHSLKVTHTRIPASRNKAINYTHQTAFPKRLSLVH